MTKSPEILALCVGKSAPFARGEQSAIDKRPVEGPIRVLELGLEGDEQADRKHHGGIDMALHAYANEHYPDWIAQFGEHHRLPAPGSFGENLALRGATEHDLCIGDRFRLGNAVVEISQARQPCWKLETHLRREGIVKAIIKNHRSGWYFRVIEEGEAEEGQTLEFLERGHDGWTLARCFSLLFDPTAPGKPGEIAEMAQLEKLSQDWRNRAAKIAAL